MKITNSQKKILTDIAKKQNIKLILLFGSFASGKEKADSDFDIAVLANEISKIDEVSLIKNLMETFQKEVDLSIINKADILLKFQIVKNSILLYGSKQDYFNFKLRTTLAYMDNKKFFDLEKVYVKKLSKNI